MSFQIPRLDSSVCQSFQQNDKASHPRLADFSCWRGINLQKKQLAPLRGKKKIQNDREKREREPLACFYHLPSSANSTPQEQKIKKEEGNRLCIVVQRRRFGITTSGAACSLRRGFKDPKIFENGSVFEKSRGFLAMLLYVNMWFPLRRRFVPHFGSLCRFAREKEKISSGGFPRFPWDSRFKRISRVSLGAFWAALELNVLPLRRFSVWFS